MRKQAFINWLVVTKHQMGSSAAARASNCATIESAYGFDLDTLSQDEFLRLQAEFRYSTTDARQGLPVKHGVRIDGVHYTGTATLRSALTLYGEFRRHPDADLTPSLLVPQVHAPTPVAAGWPQWEEPNEEDSLLLARVLTRHARFLEPEIVRALVEDNHRHAVDWRAGLGAHDVPADAYLWQGSPCAFPGVRRYAGSDEIATYRGRKESSGRLPNDALALDDNDYPKHLWSFVFRGKPFQKQGPLGYNLAHLADHKNHNNRAADDFRPADGTVPGRLYGLYTCPTNTVFLPMGLLKPTDFHSKVRGLFIRKAQALYGGICRIVPPYLNVPDGNDAQWGIDCFEWAAPVGDATHVDRFLQFRERKVSELLDRAQALMM